MGRTGKSVSDYKTENLAWNKVKRETENSKVQVKERRDKTKNIDVSL